MAQEERQHQRPQHQQGLPANVEPVNMTSRKAGTEAAHLMSSRAASCTGGRLPLDRPGVLTPSPTLVARLTDLR